MKMQRNMNQERKSKA